MDPYNTNYTNLFLAPIVQPWEPRRYRSPAEYLLDPVATKTTQVWNSTWSQTYSSLSKSYYPVVPYNTQCSRLTPLMGEFDCPRLPQTNVFDLIKSSSPSGQLGIVSLGKIISPLLNVMGTIESGGKNLGTCTLIAHNLVLVARHAIEGQDVKLLKVTFGYTEFNGAFYEGGHTYFDRVVEEDALRDYAIVQLKEPLGKNLGFAPLNADVTLSAPALLHYPLGKPLKVSVHAFVQTQCQTDCLLTYHDSDYFSSGGAYFDPKGRMVALHLGAELEQGTMNLLRFALPLETIVRRNPHSLLNKFASGQLSQACSYTAENGLTYLAPARHHFLIDEEGRESEKILRGLLEDPLKKDKKIKRTKDKTTISFSPSNLAYIATNYPTQYAEFVKKSLGITGLHEFTRLYSVTGVIESDHTIPHHVWTQTTQAKMKKLVADGAGKRPGENEMPAVTIPWEIHRKLLTTGGVAGYQAFHEKLIKLCDDDKVDDALILCYQEYAAKGLNLKEYEGGLKKSLKDHVTLGLISEEQEKNVLKTVFPS